MMISVWRSPNLILGRRSYSTVRIFETSARDGLQARKVFVPTEQKINLINGLSLAGFKDIEVASVTKLPQMRDGEAVFKGIKKYPGRRYWVLVLNPYGFRKAVGWGAEHFGLAGSLSNEFSIANTKLGIKETFETRHIPILNEARAVNKKVRVYFSCCFGFKQPDDVSIDDALRLASLYLPYNVEFVMSDTMGYGTNERAGKLFQKLILSGFPRDKLAGHFHGPGDKVIDIIQELINGCGIKKFDTSFEQLGGCPAAQNQLGRKLNNAPTISTVKSLHFSGHQTGIDLEKLEEVYSNFMSQLPLDL